MSLAARQLALQGFLLTPIAMAVQGLIALLEEEQKRQQVYGSGKKGPAVPHYWPPNKDQDADEIRRKVYEKYEAIEAAQERDALAAKPLPVKPAESAYEPKEEKSHVNSVHDATQTVANWPELQLSAQVDAIALQRRHESEAAARAAIALARRQADEEALILLIAGL